MPFIIDDNKHLVQFSISMIKMKKESEPKSASELGNSNNAEKDFGSQALVNEVGDLLILPLNKTVIQKT